MASKTRQSGRADFLLRMPLELKARLDKAAAEEGATIRDLALYAIERMLDARDAEIAVRERRADLESRVDEKFREIMSSLAGGDLTGLRAAAFGRLQEKAEAALAKWRDYAQTFRHAEPRSRLEALCKEYESIEAQLEDARQMDTFGDEGLAGKYGYDPDDPDGDERESEDELYDPAGNPDAE